MYQRDILIQALTQHLPNMLETRHLCLHKHIPISSVRQNPASFTMFVSRLHYNRQTCVSIRTGTRIIARSVEQHAFISRCGWCNRSLLSMAGTSGEHDVQVSEVKVAYGHNSEPRVHECMRTNNMRLTPRHHTSLQDGTH